MDLLDQSKKGKIKTNPMKTLERDIHQSYFDPPLSRHSPAQNGIIPHRASINSVIDQYLTLKIQDILLLLILFTI